MASRASTWPLLYWVLDLRTGRFRPTSPSVELFKLSLLEESIQDTIDYSLMSNRNLVLVAILPWVVSELQDEVLDSVGVGKL